MNLWSYLDRAGPAPARPSGARLPRSFQAAATDRLTASWRAETKAINDELKSDLDKLRARSRDLAKNNDYAKKFLRMVWRNVVGAEGVILQARVEDGPSKPDRLANNAIEAAFARWARRGSAEITGRQSFADLQRSVITAVARDGEALLLKVRGKDAGNPEGFALQHLDVARLDTQRNQAPAQGRPAIVMGVELDRYQRPVAYWLKLRADASTQSAQRIPADDVLHLYLAEDAEQVRGTPWMHAAILSLHDLGEFNRSALLNARKSADTIGYIVSPGVDARAYADDHSDEDSEPIKLSAPGTYDVLPEGYDIKTPEFAYPNQVFDPFTKTIVRRIASGLDVAAHNLSGDMTEVNYSSARIAELAERDSWMTIQNWLIGALLEPVFDEWYARALAAGTLVMENGSSLPASKAEKFRRHEWQPRRWSWVDPLKEQEAAALGVRSGFITPQQVAAQQGLDLEDVINSIAAANEMAVAKGLPAYSAPAPAPAKPAPSATEAALEKAALGLAARALEPVAAPAAPAITIHNAPPAVHLTQGEVRNDITVQPAAAPAVEIRNEIAVPPAPTPEIEVRVEAILPEQPAPIIEVKVETPDEIRIAALPARVTTTEITRDAAGNITASAQTERDA